MDKMRILWMARLILKLFIFFEFAWNFYVYPELPHQDDIKVEDTPHIFLKLGMKQNIRVHEESEKAICYNKASYNNPVISNKEDLISFLNQLSLEERQKLEDFFCFLIFRSHFGYTLYGSKPVSVEGFCVIPDFRELLFTPETYILREGLEIWEKYRLRFPIKNYALFSHVFKSEDDCQQVEIVLINCKFFRIALSDLASVIADLDIFNLPENRKHILQSESFKREIASGILFGYGLQNSLNFAFSSYFLDILSNGPSIPEKLPDLFYSIPHELQLNIGLQAAMQKSTEEKVSSDCFKKALEAYFEYQKKQQLFSEYSQDNPLNKIRLPVFMADFNLDETDQFARKYHREQKLIKKYFHENHSLECILIELCGL